MNLGEEWSTEDVISTLASTCLDNGEEGVDEHASVWIDQLCMPQATDQILRALANIPSIYRNLDVVIMMPGGVCGCLGQMGDAITPSIGVKCLNAVGTCSYFFRQWTGQEMLYSYRVRLVRTSLE